MYQLIIQNGQRQGQHIQSSGRELTIGRDPQNRLQLVEDGVSANHCVVCITRNGIVIRDCRSTNGVYVNDQRVEEARLASGDVIELGGARLRFEFVHGTPGEHRRHNPLFWLSVLVVALAFAVEFGAIGLAVWTRTHRFTSSEVAAILRAFPLVTSDELPGGQPPSPDRPQPGVPAPTADPPAPPQTAP